MIQLGILLFLGCSVFAINDYLWQGYLGILYVGVIVSLIIKKRVGIWPALLYIYLTICTLAYLIFPMDFYRGEPSLDVDVILGLQTLTMQAYLYIVMLVIPFFFMTKRHEVSLVNGICLLALFDSYIMFFKFLMGQAPFWLMNNPAIDVSFISCVLPFLIMAASDTVGFFQEKWRKALWVLWMLGVPIFICIASKTSSGVLGVGVGLAAFILSDYGFKKIYLMIAGSLAAGLAGIGYFMQRSVLFDSNGRWLTWLYAMQFWQNHGSKPPYIPHFMGAGLGSFFMYGPTLQMQDALKISQKNLDVLFWMHNDPLQILFETGWIGLGLTLIVFGLALWKARYMPAIFASLCAFGAISFIQMPMRFFIFSFWGIFLIVQALSPSEEKGPQNNKKQIEY